MKRRFAIVTPWFGADATGGAESLARELAEQLSLEHDVTILTTCSRAFLAEWDENYYAAGSSREGDYTVHRFEVDPRRKQLFDEVNAALLALPKERWHELAYRASDTDPFIDESINSTALIEHLVTVGEQRYDAVLFLPYLYGVIVRGIESFPGRSHLLPCLHDEAYARIPRIEAALHRAASLLMNSEGEAELALRLYGPGMLHKTTVIGSGITVAADVADDALPKGVVKPYLLYLGRRDDTKNVGTVVEAMRAYRASTPDTKLSLVLAGPGHQSFEDRSSAVIDLGFVNAAEKAALLKHARGVLQPSFNESYSRVLMEAWQYRVPVAAHAHCLATATAVKSANGGFLANDQADWTEVIRRFDRLTSAEREELVSGGEAYAREHADWHRVIARLLGAIGLASAGKNGVHHRRIDQVVQTLDYGDAISDYTVYLSRRLREIGFDSTIYAEGIGPLVADQAEFFSPKKIAQSDALIYHSSIACGATEAVASARAKRALIYHNITPPEFFQPYNPAFAELLETGRNQTAALTKRFDKYAADSRFNAVELEGMGAAEVTTLPVVVDFRRFDNLPDPSILARNTRGIKLLYVGRVSPNKGLRKLIESFEAVLCFDERATLSIVGRFDPSDAYFHELQRLLIERRMEMSVQFCGMVSESELHSYYRSSDIFITMSEHEGFCVPLVEAMFFDLPVVAAACTAIPETLGAGGLLVSPTADPIEIGAAVWAVCSDVSLRLAIIAAQRERRTFYLPQAANQRIDAFVEELLA